MPRRQTAADELHAVLAEQGRLPGEMREAFVAGDEERLLALRQRQNALPGDIWLARARVLQESVAQLERELVEAEQAIPELSAAVEAANAVVNEGRERQRAAQGQLWAVSSGRQAIQLDLRTARRELAVHLNGIDKPGSAAGRAMSMAGSSKAG